MGFVRGRKGENIRKIYQELMKILCAQCDVQRMVIQVLTKGDKDNEKPA